MVTYQPRISGEGQTLKYAQGVGTLAVRDSDHELFMYPTFKMQGPSQPTFTIGYANSSAADVNFSADDIKAYFRGTQVPIYTYAERIDEIQSDKRGKQIALAILGGFAAGAAAYGVSHQTYTSNYSGAVVGRHGVTNFYGSNTLRVYDPASGILAGAVVGGATGLGIRQLEFNAQAQEEAANSILQANTVEPLRMVSGHVILKNCCDKYAGPNDVVRFEVTANSKTSVFEFVRTGPGGSFTPATSPAKVAQLSAQTPALAVPPNATIPPVAAKNNPAELVPVPVPAQAPPTKLAKAVPLQTPRLAGGQDGYSAEKLASSQGCSSQSVASLVAKGAGFESYSVTCTNGDAMAIRCEMGVCRVLR